MRAFLGVLSLVAVFSLAARAEEADAAGENSLARLAERARRMVVRQEYADALVTLERAMDIDPTYLPLWRSEAGARIALGQNEAARQAIAVCLLKNPGDIDANVLSLLNTLKWEGIPERERTLRVGERLSALGWRDNADVLAEFAGRQDFSELLAPLLRGWRRGNNPLDAARTVLQLYSANRLREAGTVLHTAADVPNKLKTALAAMLERATENDGLGAWVAERGGLTRRNGAMVLTAAPESQAFAWLRLSPGWKNIAVHLDLSSDRETPRELYLRYESPASFLRVAVDGENLLVQERLPGLGVAGIFEQPLNLFDELDLRVLLKGERLSIFAGDQPLTGSYLAVSPSVASGAVAVSCDNPSPAHEREAMFNLEVAALPDRWVGLDTAASPEENRAVLNRPDTTGALLPVGDDVQSGWLSATLLAAANHGVMTFARLPKGNFDTETAFAPLADLPEVLVESLWTGVVFEPGRAADWPRLADAAERARTRGLRTALLLTPEIAADLAGRPGRLEVDWLLCVDGEKWSDATLRDLGNRYGDALYGRSGGAENFSAVTY